MTGFHGRWGTVEPWLPGWLWNLRIEFVSLAFPHILISSSSPRPLDFSTPSICQNHGLARMTGFHGRWRTEVVGIAPPIIAPQFQVVLRLSMLFIAWTFGQISKMQLGGYDAGLPTSTNHRLVTLEWIGCQGETVDIG